MYCPSGKAAASRGGTSAAFPSRIFPAVIMLLFTLAFSEPATGAAAPSLESGWNNPPTAARLRLFSV
jgi:hypothetical protein